MIDPQRIADICSILRPPFTHNYKNLNHPKQTSIDLASLRQAESYTIEHYTCLLNASSNNITLFDRPRRRSLTAAVIEGLREHRPAYAEPIADQCAQMREFRAGKGAVGLPTEHGVYGGAFGFAHAR